LSTTITYSLPYNNLNTQLPVSVSQLLQDMFYGVKMCTPTGDIITDKTIEGFIKLGQEEIERTLTLKLFKTVVDESKDFYVEDWGAWNTLQTTFPVRKAFELNGFINTVRQIQYPPEWLSTRKTSDGRFYRRNIFLVPMQGGTVNQGSVVFSGITPHMGFMKLTNIPNYWQMVYTTGFDQIPADIIKAVEYLAAIPIYMILGNAILSKAGLTSQSIGLDGLSQSKSIDAGGYTAKIKQIKDELIGTPQQPGLMNQLRDYYNGYNFTVL
jgi:hypothetical protein